MTTFTNPAHTLSVPVPVTPWRNLPSALAARLVSIATGTDGNEQLRARYVAEAAYLALDVRLTPEDRDDLIQALDPAYHVIRRISMRYEAHTQAYRSARWVISLGDALRMFLSRRRRSSTVYVGP